MTVSDKKWGMSNSAFPFCQVINEISSSPRFKALELMDFLHEHNEAARYCGRLEWQICAGIASSPVVVGIVGTKKYDSS